MKIVKGLAKTLLAGIVAAAIVSAIMCIYRITPIHIENRNGSTDYVWSANSIWVQMTEGISWGRFDANGFNNIEVVDEPDVIVLGSSHMEATNVMQNKNAAYLLGEKLGGGYSVYNMGISGHHLFKVCQYLPANIKLYQKPPKVIVVETSSVAVTEQDKEEVLQGTVEYTPSHSNGIIGILQKIPFFRMVYSQMEAGLFNIFLAGSNSAGNSSDDQTEEKPVFNQDAYDEFFEYLASLEKEYGTQLILCYHPTGRLQEDGRIAFRETEELEAFSKTAAENGITFVDLTDSFEKMYYEDHKAAHGFITGKLEWGHLNANGHAAMADALYETIMQLEKEGTLCR